MLKHETKLIDPDADLIVASLSAATADANKRCRARLLADDNAKWRKFARDAAAAPEGYAMFRGGKGGVPATQVLAAWWTDSIGRKHVVLRGRRVEHDEAKRLLNKDELEKRPALWHAYPEYVCRRTVGKQEQIVCACGCGAVGAPESLGWMGETCGPCFDRKEEIGAGALRTNLPGVLYGDRGPLGAVACSADGTRVAAAEGDNSVTYWDIATRTRTTMKFSGVQVPDVAITPNGAHLLAVGVGAMVMGGMFAALDLSPDPPTRVDPEGERAGAPPGWCVAALPDPGLAIIHRPDPANNNSLGAIVRVPSGEVVKTIRLTPGYGGRFALSPDGKRLATIGTATAVFDIDKGAQQFRVAGNFAHVAFSHDGTRLIAAKQESLQAFDANTGGPNWPKVSGYGGPANWITALAVDPTGKWVFVGGWQGTLSVADARTLHRVATFEWHLGTVRGLAVSADGSRLFSSGGDGCVKVWPVSTLLK